MEIGICNDPDHDPVSEPGTELDLFVFSSFLIILLTKVNDTWLSWDLKLVFAPSSLQVTPGPFLTAGLGPLNYSWHVTWNKIPFDPSKGSITFEVRLHSSPMQSGKATPSLHLVDETMQRNVKCSTFTSDWLESSLLSLCIVFWISHFLSIISHSAPFVFQHLWILTVIVMNME